MSITFNDLLTEPKYREMSEDELKDLIISDELSEDNFQKGLKHFNIKNGNLSPVLFEYLQKLKAESEKKAEPLSSAIKEHGVENMIFNRKSLPDEIDMSKYIKPEPSIQITDQKAREICAKYFNCPPNEIKIV